MHAACNLAYIYDEDDFNTNICLCQVTDTLTHHIKKFLLYSFR